MSVREGSVSESVRLCTMVSVSPYYEFISVELVRG